jgi:hypothetical protein
MPRLKMEDDEFDVDELEQAEYDEDSQVQPYTGPTPPNNTIIPGRIKKMWWTFTANDDRLLKVLWEADESAGKYKGFPVWDNVTFNTKSKWRWKPFLDAYGLTVLDVKKKLFVVSADPEDDHPSLGAELQKIGTLVPGEESADSRIIVVHKRDNQGNMRANVVKYLPYEDEDADYEDEDEEDDDDEEQPPPPKRARAAKSAGTSKAGAARRRPEPEPADDEDDEDQEEEAAPEPARKRRAAGTRPAPAGKPARPSSAGTTRRTATSGRVAGKPTRGRVNRGSDEEPPF